MADPYPLPCPNCGHRFSLADLKTMAVGDGFRRFIFVEGADGTPEAVDFNDYNPATTRSVDALAAVLKDHERRKG